MKEHTVNRAHSECIRHTARAHIGSVAHARGTEIVSLL